jgi:hypothetical protein
MFFSKIQVAALGLVCLPSLIAEGASAQCFVIGDSIAVGLAGQFSYCESRARVGLSSTAIMRLAMDSPPAEWAAISAGSNDPANRNLQGNLEAIRARVRADRVIWILPHNPRAAMTVRAVAAARGDDMVSFAARRDGVHPQSYVALARGLDINADAAPVRVAQHFR